MIAPKYNGQALDEESNLYYYNARHYDPEIARFVTADSVTDGPASIKGWNRYMYVGGNPIMYKDPTGHEGVKRTRLTGSEAKSKYGSNYVAGVEVTNGSNTKFVPDQDQFAPQKWKDANFTLDEFFRAKSRGETFVKRAKNDNGQVIYKFIGVASTGENEGKYVEMTITQKELYDLHPKLRELSPKFGEKAELLFVDLMGQGYKFRISEALRTAHTQKKYYDESIILKQEGKNPKTGTYLSNHINWDGTGAYAVDVYSDNKKVSNKSFWKAYGKTAEKYGLTWGGRWSNPYDPPHIQAPKDMYPRKSLKRYWEIYKSE